jgi:hypothetical protein|tara:strand:- start:230 stop:1462 length:1233 start_codon:yes stop_codon:yes gene_type:complete
MGLWGTTTAFADKPKFLPDDANAAGSTGSKEHAIAVAGGWGLSPGLAASGNDNTDAMPEVLVCVRNISLAMGNASVIGIDFAEGAVADTGTFDLIITFDEAVDITSAAWSANQTITNKAYVLLSRVGQTDMVEDSTVACMYFSGSGTNQLTFRGTVQTNAAAGYLAFNGQGVGDTGIGSAIIFDGSSVLNDSEEGTSTLGLRQESGTAAAPTLGDSIILNGTSGAVATVNGALSQATTLVIDTVTGTLAVGQVITVKDLSAAITDAESATGLSTDNTLTITAVASQTSVTVSEPITVADNVILLAHADAGDEMIQDGLSLVLAGPTFATRSDVTSITRTGDDQTVVAGILEDATDGFVAGSSNAIVFDTEADDGDNILVEDSLSNIATYVATGSSSGTAYILNGVTVTAS